MIDTKEHYERIFKEMRERGLGGSANAAIDTIEALRPFFRLTRETLILKVASATVCGHCATSWLDGQGESHEENCILYGMPEWLAEVD